MSTGAEVADKPVLAVALAVKAYAPTASGVVVKLNSAVVTEPSEPPLLKNCTLVTEPLLLVTEAEIFTLAGSANTLPPPGLVMVTPGGSTTAATFTTPVMPKLTWLTQ
jgi:hypothetical protein